jgi:hypothetical protein
MTDNGSCYRSRAFAKACQQLRSASSTFEPNPTPRRPTARPSASSKPRSANGHTPQPSTDQINAATPSPHGCIATTGTGPMLASPRTHPSADSA